MSTRKREDDAEKQQHAQLRESSSQRPLGVQTSTLLRRYEPDKASFPTPAERWLTVSRQRRVWHARATEM